ncbi:hypothetical protein OIV83_003234 [Microbotryomycetes sp. JL201]|nr:hypothetical protein OIV83_003234 [Microbotryomycetes sp. JL201]
MLRAADKASTAFASYRLAGSDVPPYAIIDDRGPALPYKPATSPQPTLLSDLAPSTSFATEKDRLEAAKQTKWPAPAAFANANEFWKALTDEVKPRGPDAHQTVIKRVKSKSGLEWEMRFYASVLHMRGNEVTVQPFRADNGDVFLWNGEVFEGLSVAPHENDGQVLFDRIQMEGPSNFFACLRNIEGPYAFVYYQAVHQRLYFGRDPLGRRSLLVHVPTPVNPYLLLTSCGGGTDFLINDWEEVPCDSIFAYNMRDLAGRHWLDDRRKGLSSFQRYPKSMGRTQDTLIYHFDRVLPTQPLQSQLLPIDPSTKEPQVTSALQLLINKLHDELSNSVRRMVLNLPRLPVLPDPRLDSNPAKVAILFSGGLDCTTLALIVDECLEKGEKIDLINVAFENPRSLAGQSRMDRSKSAAETATTADTDASTKNGNNIDKYDVPDRKTGKMSWLELRRIRPNRTWQFIGKCKVNVPYQEMLEHRQRVIDLMSPQHTVMDLSIAIAFYFAARGKGHLAATLPNDAPRAYTSRARVLLSGLGADELLGGYARHRKAFQSDGSTLPSLDDSDRADRSGDELFFPQPRPVTLNAIKPTPKPSVAPGNWSGLVSELSLDLSRISTRNLGRDDRIISFHAKEVRYPFLHSKVVDLITSSPVWLKMDFRFEQGLGDKLLLRLLAKQLGLTQAYKFPKRAIHFGARTAKMEIGTSKHKGHDLL